MTASDILAGLRRRGFAVSLSAADKVLVSPGATLGADDRKLIAFDLTLNAQGLAFAAAKQAKGA